MLHDDLLIINKFVDSFVQLTSFSKAKSKEKWIPNNLKSGRFKGWSLADMKKQYTKLVNKKDKTKEEISEMRALALGIRFKGSDIPGGKKKSGL